MASIPTPHLSSGAIGIWSIHLHYSLLRGRSSPRGTQKAPPQQSKVEMALVSKYPDGALVSVPSGNEVRGAWLPAASIAVFGSFILIVIYLPR